MIYYFAYGSNLNKSQMEMRVGAIQEPQRAVLTGYKLVFNKWAKTRGCCAANIEKTGNPTDKVEGAIYKLTDTQLAQLDKNEGYNPAVKGSPFSYQRQPIKIENADGKLIKVETYIAARGTNQRIHQPNLAYMKNLLEGKPYFSDSYYNKLLDYPLCDGKNARNRIDIVDTMPNKDNPTKISASLSALRKQILETKWEVGMFFCLFATPLGGTKRIIDGKERRLPHHVALMIDQIEKATSANANLKKIEDTILNHAKTALSKTKFSRSQKTIAFYEKIVNSEKNPSSSLTL